MAKPGLNLDSCHSLIREKCLHSGWALCVGAGTSVPVFPNWEQLVRRLLRRDVPSHLADQISDNLIKTFNLDALIQAASDRLKLGPSDFARILSEELYCDIRKTVGPGNWQKIADILTLKNPGDVAPSVWISFLQIIKKNYPDVSALVLARLLHEIASTDLSPAAILSFNAEPILFALTNAMGASATPSTNSMKRIIDPIVRSTSKRTSARIPMYFCHGLVPVDGASGTLGGKQFGARDGAIDKLVFSESEYLQLANTSFSWQSAVFTDVCLFRSVVFVGLSLSDPNMRRWLSWIHQNRTDELSTVQGYSGDATNHYWINRRPNLVSEQEWIESSVAHLGVRLVWLEEWSELEEAMRRMLGR